MTAQLADADRKPRQLSVRSEMREGAPLRAGKLPAAKLRIHDLNARERDFGDLRELADSIAEHGLIQPVVVQPDGAGKFEITDGARRFLALTVVLRRTMVPVLIAPRGSDLDVQITVLATDVQNRAMSAAERGRKALELIEGRKVSAAEVARLVGVPVGTVYSWVHAARNTVPDEAAEAVVPAQRTRRGCGTVRRRPPVRARVRDLRTRWADQLDSGQGLTGEQARELLAELDRCTATDD